MLYNNFFYTLLSFLLYLYEDFHNVCDNIDAFFLFLLEKDFNTFHKYIEVFCFSFIRKDFDTFSKTLFEADKIKLTFFIYMKKIFHPFFQL